MPLHHHPGDPEKDDVEAGDQHVAGVIARQLRRLLRPTERRERPQRRREPGVEHVLFAPQRHRRRRNAPRPRCAPPPRLRRRRRCRPARTRPGSGAPTIAGARCTRAGCCASTRKTCFPTAAGRNWVCPVSTAAIAGFGQHLRRCNTIGRSATARSPRRSGRGAAPSACGRRSSRSAPPPRDRPATCLRASKRSRPR